MDAEEDLKHSSLLILDSEALWVRPLRLSHGPALTSLSEDKLKTHPLGQQLDRERAA